MYVVVVVQADPDLFQITFALSTPCRLTSLLHGWQQQRHQNRDDRNDDQQLDKRKTFSKFRTARCGYDRLTHRTLPKKNVNEKQE